MGRAFFLKKGVKWGKWVPGRFCKVRFRIFSRDLTFRRNVVIFIDARSVTAISKMIEAGSWLIWNRDSLLRFPADKRGALFFFIAFNLFSFSGLRGKRPSVFLRGFGTEKGAVPYFCNSMQIKLGNNDLETLAGRWLSIPALWPG